MPLLGKYSLSFLCILLLSSLNSNAQLHTREEIEKATQAEFANAISSFQRISKDAQ